ncbi:MAG: CoA-transferase subunit beta [Desulfitobacteriaceae bacterium]
MKSREQAYMVITMARLLRDGEIVFHGVASPVPMLATLFAQKAHAPKLTYLNITGSINPHPSQLPQSTVDPKLLKGTSALFTMQESFDLAAKGRLDTVFLSGVQIDRGASINMSTIGSGDPPKVRLPGGAGSAFLAQKAHRVLMWRTKHDTQTFIEKVPFCTATPLGEVYVVTPLGLFRKNEGELMLEGLYPFTTLEEVKAHTGWKVTVSPTFQMIPEITSDDYKLLDKLDPTEALNIEF